MFIPYVIVHPLHDLRLGLLEGIVVIVRLAQTSQRGWRRTNSAVWVRQRGFHPQKKHELLTQLQWKTNMQRGVKYGISAGNLQPVQVRDESQVEKTVEKSQGC